VIGRTQVRARGKSSTEVTLIDRCVRDPVRDTIRPASPEARVGAATGVWRSGAESFSILEGFFELD
jgi:hypothetical protein